jgi:tRNA modification GTPase
MTDTLYALATPPGRGAIAVVRLSGPATGAALKALGAGDLKPRRASLRTLRDPSGEAFDQALVLWMPGPASFTGEDCAELHLHGGRAVFEACARALSDLGLRPAEPGEFSRRAFQNGRMDLTQAEAVADLVDAESDAQRRQALGQLGGALSERYGGFRASLLSILALLEAEIDFPDEEGVPGGLSDRVGPMIAALSADIDAALGQARRGERIREGYRIVLIGDTNAGKSTLFNRLAGREAAIVTPTPGTTRDVLEAHLTMGGYAVTLMDTAGLRDTADPIEAEGVRRARARAAEAELRLWVRAPGFDGAAVADLVQPGDLAVLNKADLDTQTPPEGMAHLAISAGRGEGLEALESWLARRIADDLSGADFPAVTRERHRIRLERARDHLASARAAMAMGPEVAAEDVRQAANALAEIVGAVGVEDVLGEVFASFCIGK